MGSFCSKSSNYMVKIDFTTKNSNLHVYFTDTLSNYKEIKYQEGFSLVLKDDSNDKFYNIEGNFRLDKNGLIKDATSNSSVELNIPYGNYNKTFVLNVLDGYPLNQTIRLYATSSTNPNSK